MEKIVIAYTPTNETYLMMFVSMESVLTNNSNNNIVFYVVIDNSFNTSYFNYLKKYKNKYNFEIIIKKVNKNKYEKISDKLNICNRLYVYDFPELIEEDRILYLNSFSIINYDLKELFNTELDNYSCACTEYISPQNIMYNSCLYKKFVFNNNIMLIDLNKWRNKQYLNTIFSQNFYNNLFRKNFNINTLFSKTQIDDLELANLIIEDCKVIDFKYNYTENWYSPNVKLMCTQKTLDSYKKFQMHLETPAIITFIGPKPLGNESCKNSYTNLWWKYAEQSPIYKDIKEYHKSNKYKLSATSANNSFKYTWLLSRIFPYIKPYIPRICIGFIIAIPLGLLDGITAFALKPYMDYVIGGKTFEFTILNHHFGINSLYMAFLIPLGVILFALIQGVLRYINDYISAWTSQRITNDVKFDLFHRLIHMHPQFFDDNPSGIVISRYMSDPQTASAGIVDQIKTITTSLFGALGLIAVMIYSSWKLAFIGVLVLCIAFIPVAIIRKRIKETSNKNMVIGGNITTNINETYSGNKVMAAYDLQDRQENYFRQQTWKSFKLNMALTKRTAWMSPLMYLIASIGIAIVLGYGTYLINTGHMTAGAFASFVTSLLLLYKPVKTLGNTMTGIQNIFVAMGRVFELFDLEPAIKEKENPITLKELKNNITFENVTFEYVPNTPVLKNLNLIIPKNETLAIVGNSGGGKSTLVNLIPRFYDIKEGSLKIDGIDIRDYSLKSLRKNISMVFQDNFLYSGTIKENILMGNPSATPEELLNAINSAHLQDLMQELPDGLDTMLGERGLTLSGGQRQRVAIARAILKNAPIVILDEATSALDNESEAIVQKAMDNLMKNRTVFIIAHRLSTIKNADRIAVINDGMLVELGSHDELIKIDNGIYKNLYEMQFNKKYANN